MPIHVNYVTKSKVWLASLIQMRPLARAQPLRPDVDSLCPLYRSAPKIMTARNRAGG